MELIEHPRYEDYSIKYKAVNRWSFLGNGFSTRDYDGRDITWFWRLVDGEDKHQVYDLKWQAPQDSLEDLKGASENISHRIISPNTL